MFVAMFRFSMLHPMHLRTWSLTGVFGAVLIASMFHAMLGAVAHLL
jgi:hypothetical protein